ncbi:hypothetical protein LX36DRAFT_666009 [Colletotrichum falcatum]|nr:hypothetical protein LX36DRAFT_666009 [Colletotrichum falcatum]
MLAKAILLMTLGAFASAQSFVGFPNSLTCKTDDGSATIQKAQIQSGIVGPKGIKLDDSAANVASGKCSTLSKVPLFSQPVAEADVAFAFNQSSNTYFFCDAQGAIENGFPSICTEN